MSDHNLDEIIIPPADTATTTEYCDPETDQNTQRTRIRIVTMLGEGPDNAVTRKELALRLGITEREVGARIHDERVQGEVICSSPYHTGYYLPSGPADTREYIATMTSRARNTFAAITSAKQYHREHWGDLNADEMESSSPELDDTDDEEVEND